MPTGAKMIVGTSQLPDMNYLQPLRLKFLEDLSLDESDFYSDGPLKLICHDEYKYLPAQNDNLTWLDVNFYKSYYGMDYERGNIELFVRAAEWIETHFPGCQIYYGHDVDDENLSLFDKQKRKKLLESRKK